MERATRQSDQETRRHQAGGSRKLVLGGIVLVIAVVVLLWLLWGFRWPPTVGVVG